MIQVQKQAFQFIFHPQKAFFTLNYYYLKNFHFIFN